MKKQKLIYVFIFFVALFASSCKEDENVGGIYSNGAFILNEGAFGKGNGSISFYDFSQDSIFNDIFMNANNRPLGDVLQSAVIDGGLMYIILNGSGKVEIANVNDFTEAGAIEGLNGPRYMAIYKGKGFITQWGEGGTLKVVDLSSKTISKTIDVGSGPEDVEVINDKIWVANGGGRGFDSTISVIDPIDNSVIETIFVGDSPKKMVVDANGNLWVLCAGNVVYDESYNIVSQTPSKLVRVSTTSFKKTGEVELSSTNHFQQLDINKDKDILYYGGGYGVAGIYAMEINATNAPTSAFIDATKYFYGFSVNQRNGEVYATEAPSFVAPGSLHRYSSSGQLFESYKVGIGPSSVVFK